MWRLRARQRVQTVGWGDDVTPEKVTARRRMAIALIEALDRAAEICGDKIELPGRVPYEATKRMSAAVLAAPTAPAWARPALVAQDATLSVLLQVLRSHAALWRDHYGCAATPSDDDFSFVWPPPGGGAPPVPRDPRGGGGGGRMIGPGGIDMRIVILLGLACLAREAQARRSEGDHLALMALGLALAPRS